MENEAQKSNFHRLHRVMFSLQGGSPNNVVMVLELFVENEKRQKGNSALAQGICRQQNSSYIENPGHGDDPWYYT